MHQSTLETTSQTEESGNVSSAAGSCLRSLAEVYGPNADIVDVSDLPNSDDDDGDEDEDDEEDFERMDHDDLTDDMKLDNDSPPLLDHDEYAVDEPLASILQLENRNAEGYTYHNGIEQLVAGQGIHTAIGSAQRLYIGESAWHNLAARRVDLYRPEESRFINQHNTISREEVQSLLLPIGRRGQEDRVVIPIAMHEAE